MTTGRCKRAYENERKHSGIARFVLILLLYAGDVSAGGVHHYVFFSRNRERITEASFLQTQFEGAQLTYSWRELEPQKDQYHFDDIQHDLVFLQSKGKKLFIQIQDVSFNIDVRPFPRYLLEDPAYHGGAEKQYGNGDIAYGWMSRRWDKAVQDRFHRLLSALGHEFDVKIEGINLPETAFDLASTDQLQPKGFSAEIYCDAIISNLAALKRAFPKSVTIQYANFMPGGKRYLEMVYQRAKELKVGLGGPDLLPYKPFQMENSYSLLKQYAGSVPTGLAVQDGNYEHRNPKTGQPVTIPELIAFATEYLKLDYIFWCTQEPYYSQKLIPFLGH